MMRTIILIVSVIGFIGCQKPDKLPQFVNLSEKFNKLTFIKNNMAEFDYAELEFIENHKLVIRSETEGQVGPFEYKESENSLIFNQLIFDIIPNVDGSVRLKSNKEEYILYPIPFEEGKINKNQIDLFYLRRCYFLVHLNFITMNEASKYLSNIIPVNTIPEEELLFTN